MIWVVIALFSVSVSLFVLGAAYLVTPAEGRIVRRRLRALPGDFGSVHEERERRRRLARRESLERFLEKFGSRVGAERSKRNDVRQVLMHAGYRGARAALVYVGIRVVLAVGLLGLASLAAAVLGTTPGHRLLLTACGGLFGWMLPFVVVRRKARRRQADLQRALPDALDLLVVCVEAGLGLNQALVRVGEEMDRVSRPLSDELTLVSLEIRAGTPREDALRNLGGRTGLADVRSFVSMLVQTDRFGTSIAKALRIHADELRTKRRQRAEEAAAKLTVKLLIPIVLFIFPSIFIVILGPAVFRLQELFGMLGGP